MVGERGGSEMAFRAICVALLLTSLPVAGCGTVANLVGSPPAQGGKTPFGGVRHDVASLEEAASGDFSVGAHGKGPSDHPQILPMVFCAADIPFSFVGDVVTWPYTAAYSFINQPIPIPPITQATVEGPPQNAPPEALPEPRIMPPKNGTPYGTP
jgi:uncharacterized protein YceK